MEVNYHGYKKITINLVVINTLSLYDVYGLDHITIEYDDLRRIVIRPYTKQIVMEYGQIGWSKCKIEYIQQPNKLNTILLYGGFDPLFMHTLICSNYEIKYIPWTKHDDINPLYDLKNGRYGFPLCNITNQNQLWNVTMTILEGFLDV